MPRGKLVTKVLRRDCLPVPENLPIKTRCIQVTIPDDLEYLLQFSSVVSLLGKWNSYQQDGAHKAADVAQLWRNVLADNPIITCETQETFSAVHLEAGVELRLKPDDHCIIQINCDPDGWQDWFNARECVAGAAGQQTGGGQPEPGQTACTNAVLPGNGVYLLPQQVNAGDIIQVTDTGGGWSDGSGLWSCPNGDNYAFGNCVGGTGSTSGSDPLPTADHASLIMKIDGVYYAATAAPFIVPSGVADANVEFQMNDPSLSDNYGSINFKVCLTTVEVVVNLTGVTGSGGSIPTILSKTQVRVGEKFTGAPQFNSSNSLYDGGFHADVAATWRITGVSNYGAVMSACDWQWESQACQVGAPAVPTTSPASTVGWVGNSNTADSLEWELVSIP